MLSAKPRLFLIAKNEGRTISARTWLAVNLQFAALAKPTCLWSRVRGDITVMIPWIAFVLLLSADKMLSLDVICLSSHTKGCYIELC